MQIEPTIKGNFNDTRYIAIRLAKEGYYSGNVGLILQEKYTIILDILTFENFCNKYQQVSNNLNDTGKKSFKR